MPKFFRFSKVIDHHSIPFHGEYWPLTQSPEEYFAKWIEWFKACGIKTEIRTGDGTCSLWREGKEEKRQGSPRECQ